MSKRASFQWDGLRSPLAWALAVLVALLALTFVDYRWAVQRQQITLQADFDKLSVDVTRKLNDRLQTYERGLLANRAAIVMAGPDGLQRQNFFNALNTRQLPAEFPGARGFGFIRRVAPHQEAQFLGAARADGWPDFRISELSVNTAERLVIQYIEPVADNLQAVGLDIASEANRRQAAQNAMQTGMATLTHPITLVQASGLPRRGFLFLLPVYRPGAALETPEQRLNAAYGLSYTPLVIDEVLADFEGLDQLFALTLTDVPSGQAADQFFFSPAATPSTSGGLRKRLPLAFYGVSWQVDIQALPAFLNSRPGMDVNQRALLLLLAAVLMSMLSYALLLIAFERRQARLNQARLAAVVDNASDAIIGLTVHGRIQSWNQAAQRLFGYAFEQVKDQSFGAFCLAPADRESFTHVLARLVQGHAVAPFAAVYEREPGERFEVLVALSPVRGVDQSVWGVSATVRNLSQELQQLALFELAMREAPVAMLLVDHAQRVKLANRKAETLFAYEPEGLVGVSVQDLVPTSKREAHQGHMQDYVAAPVGRQMVQGRDIWALTRDGREVPVEVGLNPLSTSQENLVMVSVVDMSSRRALEQQLQDAAMRARLAAQAAGVGVWVWRGRDGRLSWDARMEAIYGALHPAPREQVDYHEWMSCVLPQDQARVAQDFLRFVELGGLYEATYRIVDRAGAVRWIKAAALMELDLHGQMQQIVGVNSDITELMNAQLEVKDLNAVLERRVEERTAELKGLVGELEAFSYSVSHDLRAPLRSIDGFSNILLTSHAGSLDATARSFLVRVRDASQRMGVLIDDLIALARLGRSEMHLQDVDLSGMAHELFVGLREAEPYRDVEVYIEPGMTAVADSRFLRIVMANLIGNAWKFTSKTPAARIEFGSQLQEGRTEYYLRDNGAGFDMRYYGKLFTAFQRLHQAQEYPGTGIGLATVQRVLRRHGGDIRAVGEVGAGASFYFWLGPPAGI